MGIFSSTYYDQKTENTVKTQQENYYLTKKIKDTTYHHPYYGYRRITAQLPREKIKVNHKRVLRIMHQWGIQGRVKRSSITTTNSKHGNLIKDRIVNGINQVCSCDITYIRILSGFVYLAAIIDIYSRKVVGYALGKTLSIELTLAALPMALATRNSDNFIHHSDQGIQYTCFDYVQLLKEYGIRISMAGKGNPYEHAYAESFFKTLKQEEVYLWE